jgi:hypothetical protein
MTERQGSFSCDDFLAWTSTMLTRLTISLQGSLGKKRRVEHQPLWSPHPQQRKAKKSRPQGIDLVGKKASSIESTREDVALDAINEWKRIEPSAGLVPSCGYWHGIVDS